jgi:hypothetical protein
MTLHVLGRGPWYPCPALIAALVAFPLANARAAPALVVDEPSPGEPAGNTYTLQVHEDGTAALHLQWSAADATPRTVDLTLSTFSAPGKPAIVVGFDTGKPAVLPYFKDAAVPAGGAVFRVVATGLEPGVGYFGRLTAVLARDGTGSGSPQPTTWNLVLLRPGAVPLFRCPDPAQTVRFDDSIVFDVPRTTPRALTVGLRLSQFLSPDSERGDVGFPAGPGGAQLVDELRDVAVTGDHLSVTLRTRGLGEAVTYSGKLSLASGGGDALDCPISIVMPKQSRGEMVADRQSLTTTVTAPWFGTASVNLSLRLFEKTRTRQLYGITVALDGSAESPDGGFDIERNMAFEINGHPVARLTRLPPEDLHDPARAIAPGGQIEVQLALKDLHVGKHALALRFTAANAAAASQRIELVVNVRHDWLRAMLAIVVALLLSFVLTKTIVGWRKRLNLRIRIDQLREQSFVEHSDLAIAVYLRVVLDQTDEMLERYSLLPPPDSVDEAITRAERGARVLTCYSRVVGALRATRCAERIKHYYRDGIAEAIQRVGPALLDQAATDAIVEALTAIEKGLTEPFPSYWANITGKGRVLAQQLRDARQTLRAIAQLDQLADTLACPDRLPNPRPEDAQVAAYDRLYWFGRLLYARRNIQPTSLLDQLSQHCRPCQDHPDFLDVDLDGLLRDADRQGWEQLKAGQLTDEQLKAEQLKAEQLKAGQLKAEQLKAGQLKARVPGLVQIQEAQPGQSYEALHPLRFVLRFDDPALNDSYFVNNILVYEWEFEFKPDREDPRMSRVTSPVRVRQPRVTMYVPTAGKLSVRARIFWPGDASEPVLEVERKDFQIAPNQDLRLLGRLEASTVAHFALMAGVAVVTGLPALYFDNATFGAYTDYVKILIWGIGIDQGKNLLQLVHQVSPDGPGSTT